MNPQHNHATTLTLLLLLILVASTAAQSPSTPQWHVSIYFSPCSSGIDRTHMAYTGHQTICIPEFGAGIKVTQDKRSRCKVITWSDDNCEGGTAHVQQEGKCLDMPFASVEVVCDNPKFQTMPWMES